MSSRRRFLQHFDGQVNLTDRSRANCNAGVRCPSCKKRDVKNKTVKVWNEDGEELTFVHCENCGVISKL